MGTKFASSRKALAMCDICGFQYKLSQLNVLVRKGFSTNLKACPTCFDPDHPQLKLGLYPVSDPQAIKDPRPDTSLGESGNNSSRGIQWGWDPVGRGTDIFNLTPDDLVATGSTGQVVVVIS